MRLGESAKFFGVRREAKEQAAFATGVKSGVAAGALPPASKKKSRASVLIIVLWISFGLVSTALYFAHSMTFELRASDNRVAGLEAEQAIEGAARYITYLLANIAEPGRLPDIQTYLSEAISVGDARFWLIGRNDRQDQPEVAYFGLVDEASKLNLNTATAEMLSYLPRMTTDLAAAIQDWRDADSTVTQGGAESETYARMKPAYSCKNANFETVDELRLVAGMDWTVLYGEDANLNGVLDMNENDGETSLPEDNKDGRLDRGLLDFVTVYSKESNITTNGTTRTNINNAAAFSSLLTEKLSAARAQAIMLQANLIAAGGGGGRGGGGRGGGGGGGAAQTTTYSNLLQFYVNSGMTETEFDEIADEITASNSQYTQGLINVNTASAEVLACIPGVGVDNAQTLVAYRASNPDKLLSIAWLSNVLTRQQCTQAGPYVTVHSYQFSADIAAVGHHGRGYRRVRFIFDTSDGTPKIVYRQDLSHLGWALGRQTRESLPQLSQYTR